MPTYEYQCQDCQHCFEVFQSITEKPLKKCPVCAGKVKRLIGAGAGLIFKGSGFYITDYKNKSESKETSNKDNTQKDDKRDVKKSESKGSTESIKKDSAKF
jgi:putative FmdB family regulatory protein